MAPSMNRLARELAHLAHRSLSICVPHILHPACPDDDATPRIVMLHILRRTMLYRLDDPKANWEREEVVIVLFVVTYYIYAEAETIVLVARLNFWRRTKHRRGQSGGTKISLKQIIKLIAITKPDIVETQGLVFT